jgi:hypothetical protein
MSQPLTKIIKTIIGNGMVVKEDFSNLTEDEKKYLHNLSKKADLPSKLEIPAPSKEEDEKDIHMFNVYKGEIMAGNDSKELIKKFKILILKLSKTGTLPKNQVSEIMTELLEMGY